MLEAVIFDLDGVLIDSAKSSRRVKASLLLSEYGIDIESVPDPHNEKHKGSTLETFLMAAEKHHGIKIDMQDFLQKAVDGIYDDLKRNNSTVDPELLRFLRELDAQGVPLAVATASSRMGANNKLRILGIEDMFRVVITADDVQEHKPDPEVYIMAMEQLGITASKCVIFEDSVVGVKAARAAGALVVGLTKYNDNKLPLDGSHHTIDDWDQISYAQLKEMRQG